MGVHAGTQLVSQVGNGRPGVAHPATSDTLEAVVRAALPGSIGAALPLVASLTARERAVFHLLGIGCDNRSIARRMSISERTAKRHVTAILVKLGLQSRLQAGLAAMAMAIVAVAPRIQAADPGRGAGTG